MTNLGGYRKKYLIMNKKEYKSVQQYTAPDIEVVEIELTQNILQPSPDMGNAPANFGGEDW
jgi:hypothetical protein